eukprot:CAMPEP_0171662332 /NCGR_PEP_ID=MMETSP0990-20121206/45464_1 /TAXON_ID=483369 /ORGANISM="non described non described, Strain CCMP2098" /LENGTH=75 /DNA_ID=CAMNT_0012244677 /DNA_START=127 /DNA_END=354 /DNA_ORIENTATION=+
MATRKAREVSTVSTCFALAFATADQDKDLEVVLAGSALVLEREDGAVLLVDEVAAFALFEEGGGRVRLDDESALG